MDRPSSPLGEAEFLEAYEAYADALFRFCLMRVNNREQALDLTHDTFTKVWEYAQNGTPIENLRALLFRAARNLIIDHYRKKKSESLDALQEDFGFDPAGTELSPEVEAEVRRAHALIASLPEEYREPVYLRFVEGLLPQQIAEALEISANVASVRISRGIQMLREKLHTSL